MPDTAYIRAIERLRDLGPMRVWSLLVTVFGDFASQEPIKGPALSMIMKEIGNKPEATRVALHRLRSDGWITSTKAGRTSLHALTNKGRQDSDAARGRIYGTHQVEEVTVFLMQNAQALDSVQYSELAPRLFIGGADVPIPEHAMILSPAHIPEWLGSQIETNALLQGYARLYDVLTEIDTTLGQDLGAVNTAALRVLLIHAWRRLALKHPLLPRAAHSWRWRGHDCRTLVHAILARYPRPDLDSM